MRVRARCSRVRARSAVGRYNALVPSHVYTYICMEVRRGAGMQPVAGDEERGARRDKTIVTPAPDIVW